LPVVAVYDPRTVDELVDDITSGVEPLHLVHDATLRDLIVVLEARLEDDTTPASRFRNLACAAALSHARGVAVAARMQREGRRVYSVHDFGSGDIAQLKLWASEVLDEDAVNDRVDSVVELAETGRMPRAV
jgi:transketolase N-terminal domain/subunit